MRVRSKKHIRFAKMQFANTRIAKMQLGGGGALGIGVTLKRALFGQKIYMPSAITWHNRTPTVGDDTKRTFPTENILAVRSRVLELCIHFGKPNSSDLVCQTLPTWCAKTFPLFLMTALII